MGTSSTSKLNTGQPRKHRGVVRREAKTKTFTLRLTASLQEQLEAYATVAGVSKTSVIERGLRRLVMDEHIRERCSFLRDQISSLHDSWLWDRNHYEDLSKNEAYDQSVVEGLKQANDGLLRQIAMLLTWYEELGGSGGLVLSELLEDTINAGE